MRRKLIRLSRGYTVALRTHLRQGRRASLKPADGLGRQAVAMALETLDLARIHEHALATLLLPSHSAAARHRMIQRASDFFAEAITPIEKTHRAARKASAHMKKLSNTLSVRTLNLAASHRSLQKGISRRRAAEQNLKESGRHCAKLLKISRSLQARMRYLTRRSLAAQEARQTKIGRELHDQIAQTLLGINVRLLTLRQGATVDAKALNGEISHTQRLVKKSSIAIARFAREFGIQHEA